GEKMRRAEASPCRIQDFGTPLGDVFVEFFRFVFGRASDAFHRRVDGVQSDFLSPFFPLLTELLRDDDVEFTTNDCRSLLQLLRDDYLAPRLLEFGGFERRSRTRRTDFCVLGVTRNTGTAREVGQVYVTAPLWERHLRALFRDRTPDASEGSVLSDEEER